jgi:hypothetical protein
LLLQGGRHQGFAIYNGGMSTQFNYVDANNTYVNVARFFDKHGVSARPQVFNYESDYAQKLMQTNLHASNYYDASNRQHMSPNSHALATPQIHMPMNSMMSSVNHYQTSHDWSFNNMQGDVSAYYSSAISPQFASPSENMPMDGKIDHVSVTYPANYSQSTFATAHVTNFSAPYAHVDAHNSASYLTYDHSRMHEISASMHMPSSTSVAYDSPPTQLQSFGSTHVSLPKESKSLGGQSQREWDEVAHEKLLAGMNKITAIFFKEARGTR